MRRPSPFGVFPKDPNAPLQKAMAKMTRPEAIAFLQKKIVDDVKAGKPVAEPGRRPSDPTPQGPPTGARPGARDWQGDQDRARPAGKPAIGARGRRQARRSGRQAGRRAASPPPRRHDGRPRAP